MNKATVLLIATLTSLLLEARLPDLIPFRKGNLWGYSDSTKKIIIEPQYESVEFFEFGRAVVKKKGKFGVIDVSGRTVVSYFYKELEAGPISGYWKAMMLGNKCGIVDSNDKFCIPAIYDHIEWCGGLFVCSVSEGERKIMNLHHQEIARYSSSSTDQGPEYFASVNCFVFQSIGRYGVIDLRGNIRLAAVYDRIRVTSCGYFVTEKNSSKEYFSAKFKKRKRLSKKCAIQNVSTVAFVLPASITIYERSGDYMNSVVDSALFSLSWGWQSGDGVSWAMMPKYESAGYFSYGLATFGRDCKLGVVDSTFKEVIEPKYELIYPVRPGFVMIVRKSRVDFAKHPDLRLFMGYVDVHGTEYWED